MNEKLKNTKKIWRQIMFNMTEEEYHQWELEQQEQEEREQMLHDALYDEEKERRAGFFEESE